MYKANEKFQLKLPSVFIFRHFCPSDVLVEVRGRFFPLASLEWGCPLARNKADRGGQWILFLCCAYKKKKVENVQFLS